MFKGNLLSQHPGVVATKLNAPELVHLRIDMFSTPEEFEDSYEEFGVQEHDWILDFASQKRSKNLLTNLKYVEIAGSLSGDSDFWPWK